MAKKLYEEQNIYNIACAIREKCGDNTTTYKTCDMADAIRAIKNTSTIEPFVLTGNCSYLFESGKLTWLIENHGDKISTNEINTCISMFANCGMTDIPLNINLYVSSGPGVDLTGMFRECEQLITLPTLDFDYTIMDFKGNYLFYNCRQLREIPSNCIKTYNRKFSGFYLSRAFTNCHSLRSIAAILDKKRSDTWETGEGDYIEMFRNCYALDEIANLPVVSGQTPGFSNTFTNCFRLKKLTFERKNNQTCYEVAWNGETAVIDLSGVGYISDSNYGNTVMTTFNSGITADKEVYDNATYQALKNDADWFTRQAGYSRYNKTSAATTLASLPIVSKGTIKFKGEAGLYTNGGAINTLTEAEIVIATANGWTVSFV